MVDDSKEAVGLVKGFTASFRNFAGVLANDLADEHSVKDPSFQRDEYIKQKTDEIANQFADNFEKSQKILGLAGTLLQEKILLLPGKDAIAQEFAHAIEMILILDNPEELRKHVELLPANTNQEFLGLSNSTLLWMYQVGNQFFKEENYENAYAIFRLVVQLNPLVCDYLIALALTQVKRNTPEEALTSFAQAIILDRDQPVPRYQSAKLYLQIGQKDDALIELEALEEIVQKKQLESLKPAVEELKQLIAGTG